MNSDDELSAFVREALLRGLPRAQVEQALAQAGWRAEQVRRALAHYADVPFPVPVPRPRPYLSARIARAQVAHLPHAVPGRGRAHR